MLAQRLPSILPPMDAREMLDVSMIASLGGELKDGQLSRRRPFRSPHHSASCQPLLVAASRKAWRNGIGPSWCVVSGRIAGVSIARLGSNPAADRDW